MQKTKKGWPRTILQIFCWVFECLCQHHSWTSKQHWISASFSDISSVCRLIAFVTCAKPQVLARGMVPRATASWKRFRELHLLQTAAPWWVCNSGFLILSLCFVFLLNTSILLDLKCFSLNVDSHKGLRETHWAAGLGPQIQMNKTYFFTMQISRNNDGT